MRNGISRQKALDAITMNPAKALGLEDRIGSLEPGKIGNVVVMSGDPLEFSSWVDMVFIQGVKAYERSSDPRLKKLLGDEPQEVAQKPTEKEEAKADAAKPAAEAPADAVAKPEANPTPEEKKPEPQ